MKTKFTLIELLIVIAVIGILLTLLLPSLARAKFNTKVTVCMSHQKQWGTTTFQSTKDNNGKFNDDTPMGSARSLHDMAYSWVKPLVNDYGFPVDAFFCPFRESQYSGEDWLFKNPTSARIGFAYWVYRWGNGTPTVVFSDKFVAKNTSDHILFSDNVLKKNADPAYQVGFGTIHEYKGNHENMNITFADNHIETIRAKQTYQVYQNGNGSKFQAINRVTN